MSSLFSAKKYPECQNLANSPKAKRCEYLRKKNKFFLLNIAKFKWPNFYTILYERKLYLFESDLSGKPSCLYHLSNFSKIETCHIEDSCFESKWTFKLTSKLSEQKSLYFASSNSTSMKNWIDSIANELEDIEKCKNNIEDDSSSDYSYPNIEEIKENLEKMKKLKSNNLPYEKISNNKLNSPILPEKSSALQNNIKKKDLEDPIKVEGFWLNPFEGEKLLEEKKVGTFMFRHSIHNEINVVFTLVMKGNPENKKYKIYKNEEGDFYHILTNPTRETKFETMDKLVKYYQNHSLPNSCYKLKEPLRKIL